jgi:uncharacterized protein (DUF697 family)
MATTKATTETGSTGEAASADAPPKDTKAGATADAATSRREEQDRHAESVIRANMYLSAASGFIPFPLVDTAASVAIDLKMLAELADVYRVEFRKDIGKSAIGAFIGALGSLSVGGALLGSATLNLTIGSIPWVGPAFRLVTQPATHAAFTYALGKVFQQHFASGGTFLTFDPAKVTAFFKQKFEEAKRGLAGPPVSKAA